MVILYMFSLLFHNGIKYFSDLQHLLANQQVESLLKKPSDLCPQLCKIRVLGKSSSSTVLCRGHVCRETLGFSLKKSGVVCILLMKSLFKFTASCVIYCKRRMLS